MKTADYRNFRRVFLCFLSFLLILAAWMSLVEELTRLCVLGRKVKTHGCRMSFIFLISFLFILLNLLLHLCDSDSIILGLSSDNCTRRRQPFYLRESRRRVLKTAIEVSSHLIHLVGLTVASYWSPGEKHMVSILLSKLSLLRMSALLPIARLWSIWLLYAFLCVICNDILRN